MEMNIIPWSPVLRYATPLPMNRMPVSTVALQHKFVSSILRYARPLLMNKIPFRTWTVKHKAISSVLRYARARVHGEATDDNNDILFIGEPTGWLGIEKRRPVHRVAT